MAAPRYVIALVGAAFCLILFLNRERTSEVDEWMRVRNCQHLDSPIKAAGTNQTRFQQCCSPSDYPRNPHHRRTLKNRRFNDLRNSTSALHGDNGRKSSGPRMARFSHLARTERLRFERLSVSQSDESRSGDASERRRRRIRSRSDDVAATENRSRSPCDAANRRYEDEKKCLVIGGRRDALTRLETYVSYRLPPMGY